MTTLVMDNAEKPIKESPGAQLSALREAKGLDIEHIAEKLHLRTKLIRLLEADDYANMPDPVFIKGYLRAYAKLLNANPEPFLEIFNRNFLVERKTEKALWQPQRDTCHAERSLRWLTLSFGLVVLVAVAVWWYKSQDNQNLFTVALNTIQEKNKNDHEDVDIRLTDLSKMRSLLTAETPYSSLENKSD
jgi:cytoskeleton protein RodZ